MADVKITVTSVDMDIFYVADYLPRLIKIHLLLTFPSMFCLTCWNFEVG